MATKIPSDEFSGVIRKAVKGENSSMPAPRRSAFIRLRDSEDEEENEEEDED